MGRMKVQLTGKWLVTLAIFFLSVLLLESSSADRTTGEVTLDQDTLDQMKALGYL